MKTKDLKELNAIRKNMRKVGAFSKYCAECGQTFGSDDLKEFLTMLEEHKCGNQPKTS